MLSPGVRFLLSKLPSLFVSLAFIGLLRYASPAVLGFEFHLPVLLLVLCVFIIFSTVGSVIWTDLQNKWDARSRGAIPPPIVEGKWSGNADTLYAALKVVKTGYLADKAYEMSLDYGPTFNWRVFWEDKIITTEPEHVKAILATEFDNFEKGAKFKDHMQSLLGDGVFNSDGEMWRFHRSMTRPFFSKDRISHFEIFGHHADEAIELLKARVRTGHAVDIQDLVSRFTLDSATEFLFGHCVHILQAGLPYSPNVISASSMNQNKDKSADTASLFSEAFANVQLTIAGRSRLGSMWSLMEIWKDKTEDDMKIVNAFIDPILRDAVAKRKKPANLTDRKEIEESETLLDHLITYTDDTKMLRDEILNIIVAGRDTTAATLTFAMYCLAMHPDVLKRLREEILAVVGSEQSPTYEHLKEMKYLRAVINETLRLYPPVPFNTRSTINATTWPNKTRGAKPWYIPARTSVVYSVFLMHRRTDLWGPDANDFDPSRFLDSRLHKYLIPNPFIFLPFNAGPRICLGQQFAYNEAGFMLVRLLQAFSGVELALDAHPAGTLPPAEWARAKGERKSLERVWPKSHLTIYVNGGLWVRLHEAPAVESA